MAEDSTSKACAHRHNGWAPPPLRTPIHKSPIDLRTEINTQLKCLEHNRLVWIVKFEILHHDHESSRATLAGNNSIKVKEQKFAAATKRMLWQRARMHKERKEFQTELAECEARIKAQEKVAEDEAIVAVAVSMMKQQPSLHNVERHQMNATVEAVVDESFMPVAEDIEEMDTITVATAAPVRKNSIETASGRDWDQAQLRRKATEVLDQVDGDIEFVREQKRVRRPSRKAAEMARPFQR